MQPQSPYGPPQPYNPQGGPNPNPQGQPQPGQPYPPHPPQPGQPYPQQPMPNQAVGPNPNGQPPMPVYAPPANLRQAPSQPSEMPPPPPAPTTPYDFFLDQPKRQVPTNPLSAAGKRYGIGGGGGPTGRGLNKFTLIIASAVAVVVILGIGSLLLPKDTTSPQWFAIAQRQQEVIRVCAMGSKAKYQTTRNFAITCQTGVTASQRELLAYMNKAKLAYESKQIGLRADPKTDAKLKTAASSSTYDDVFREIAEQQLNIYNRSLTTLLGTTTGVNGREVLAKNQRSAELLLKMVADDTDKTIAPATTEDAN